MSNMYNRYIPQPDGSYRRNRVADHSKQEHPPVPPVREKTECPPPPPCDPPTKAPPRQNMPVGGFLRQLLPKDFDTGDLIVILLLLLMAGDCQEDRNNALLTIALYFMM